MENAEEILQCLDEFSKVKPKDIPRELEEYLCFVAKTGDPIYQWPLIKCLFREKLINVITEFYETCPSVEIPPCPNVDAFNYDTMKNFILEKLDTFAAAPFTVQRICELLTTPRKEYNRIDKYMRALEKNILVVSTKEPGNRRSTENGDSVVNGLESEHVSQDIMNSDINVEVEMDDSSVYTVQEPPNLVDESQTANKVQDTFISESKETETATCSSSLESVITSRPANYMNYPQNSTEVTETETPTTETTTVLTTPTDNITVTIANVSEEEIDQLTEEEPQPQSEPPIYVSPVNHKENTSIYLGTNEHGDQVYRIKYEPYVEIDYMSLPETAFPQETVYENQEIKQETSQTPAQPDEPKPEQSEPETTKEFTKTESQNTTEEKENWEVSNSTETAISSSDEVTPTEIIPEKLEEPKDEGTTENQVTESNLESDPVVSQTEEVKTESESSKSEVSEMEEVKQPEETVEEITPVPVEESTVTKDEPTTSEVSENEPAEAMEVDEPIVTESEPENQEPTISQTTISEESSTSSETIL